MKNFKFDFEYEAGVDNCAMFTVAFNADEYTPARINCSVENSYPEEGGVPEDITIFFHQEVKGKPPVMQEVPEYLWEALGFSPKMLEEICLEHLEGEAERMESQRGDEKFDSRNDR
jgi:hypothetical protein